MLVQARCHTCSTRLDVHNSSFGLTLVRMAKIEDWRNRKLASRGCGRPPLVDRIVQGLSAATLAHGRRSARLQTWFLVLTFKSTFRVLVLDF